MKRGTFNTSSGSLRGRIGVSAAPLVPSRSRSRSASANNVPNSNNKINKPKTTTSSIANNNYVSEPATTTTSTRNNVRNETFTRRASSIRPLKAIHPINSNKNVKNVNTSNSSPATGLAKATAAATASPKLPQQRKSFSNRPSTSASNSSVKSIPLNKSSSGRPNSGHVLYRNNNQSGGGGSNIINKSGSAYLGYSSSAALPNQSPNSKTFPLPVSYLKYPNTVIAKSLESIERSRAFRALVEKAIKERKVFSIGGVYPAIRKALKKRGWVEKPQTMFYNRSVNAISPLARTEEESDVIWLARALRNYVPDFLWVIRRDNLDWKSQKEQLINRFPRAGFTTKVGLAACLQHMHWFSEAGISDTFFPRCYRLSLEDERQAFQEDYRLTACMSYLRYFVEKYEKKGHKAVSSEKSPITSLSIDFACRQLGNYIRGRRHEDLDWMLPPNTMNLHWENFIIMYYGVVHDKKKIRFDSEECCTKKFERAKKVLETMAHYWPQAQVDGIYNMWICKPGARSRGIGIRIMNNLERILDLMTHSNFRENNWVVQKYIEKPMLIYKTKFDIRQWFLVINWAPLTVWFYKESYVRFCSKPFVLENYHESIHLCNNSVQCRYQNSAKRDANLPKENMWSSEAFQAYLKSIDKGEDVWQQIYSKMKQAIVGVMLASQEDVQNKRGCYELYGADFMLTEDFQPWLIEINSCPCMAASTKVTAKMCAQCLEDTVKVVIDRRTNRYADTGKFEMIYRQNSSSVPQKNFNGHELTIIGQKLNRNIEWPALMSNPLSNAPSKHRKSMTTTVSQPMPFSRSSLLLNNINVGGAGSSKNILPSRKETLLELIQKMRNRNKDQMNSRNNNSNSNGGDANKKKSQQDSQRQQKGNKKVENIRDTREIEK